MRTLNQMCADKNNIYLMQCVARERSVAKQISTKLEWYLHYIDGDKRMEHFLLEFYIKNFWINVVYQQREMKLSIIFWFLIGSVTYNINVICFLLKRYW